MRIALCVFMVVSWAMGQAPDPRHIVNGLVIPDETYADQPYIVKTDDGAWLCVITTGKGAEGEGGQHVISLRSKDRGRTWEKAVDVEPAGGPEASYAVLLKTPGGRVYVFYNHNTDNVRQVIADKPAYKDGLNRRVDSLGHFVFKYSDDHGRTWSAQRYDIPQRDFEIDRKNPYGGKLKFFWTVGKAFTYKGAGYVPLHKVGGFGEGLLHFQRGRAVAQCQHPQRARPVQGPMGDPARRARSAYARRPAAGRSPRSNPSPYSATVPSFASSGLSTAIRPSPTAVTAGGVGSLRGTCVTPTAGS